MAGAQYRAHAGHALRVQREEIMGMRDLLARMRSEMSEEKASAMSKGNEALEMQAKLEVWHPLAGKS